MGISFEQCGRQFSADTPEGDALRMQWGWNGTIIGIDRNYTTQISREGCLNVCGTDTDTYPWKDVSGVITTWILPVIGTLLQAPFESNATRRTLLAITRWVGSPIASLAYVLWNIKVSAKAALMVDMAVKYEETPDCETDFGSMRDSMYLLLVMNQYTLKSTAMAKELQKEAEGLLRIALFSKDLVLTDTAKPLYEMRTILARELREMRRRGVVPVFVSTMWFLFAFALSIQDAFGDLGANTTAHDLALGCLLAWFPILILGSIVDRNPIAAEAIRKKLSTLVDHVRHALRNKQHREAFISSFQDEPDYRELKSWIENVANKAEHMHDFFVDFAGQARVRWHYGAAHAILSDIENCYIADKGRNWLASEREARASLVLGPINEEGLVWFDIREFWQVFSAVIIVAGSCGGAFILSFFTPTVGLGCRSGGYTIFFSVSLGLLIVEMTVWLFLSPYEVDAPWLARAGHRFHHHGTFSQWRFDAHERLRGLKRRASDLLGSIGNFLLCCVVRAVLLIPWLDKKAVKERLEDARERIRNDLRAMSPQRRWELFFFRPVETFNTIWLIYIVLAQVFGWYRTCHCVTSSWAGGGGYLDFSQQDTSTSKWVLWYWTAGTVLTALIMGLSMFYITVEWCQQSFLSTEDYHDAMAGLSMTRAYRSATLFARRISRAVSYATLGPLEKVALRVGLIRKPQKTLAWTREHTWNPDIPPTSATSRNHALFSPSIELTDYDAAAAAAPRQVRSPATTPLSYFPSATASPRIRNGSDASLGAADPLLNPLSPPRGSEDSAAPLIQRPSRAHQMDSEDGRVSFETA